jgi:hypothetical protein
VYHRTPPGVDIADELGPIFNHKVVLLKRRSMDEDVVL